MVQLPVCKVESCDFNELPMHTPVWNSKTVEEHVWIHVFPEITQSAEVCGLQRMENKSFVDVEYTGHMSQDACKPWFRIDRDILSMDPGLHIYRLKFVTTISPLPFSVYFAYIIQEDNPEKPYIYMNRGDS